MEYGKPVLPRARLINGALGFFLGVEKAGDDQRLSK
jgi:hypothetical protein